MEFAQYLMSLQWNTFERYPDQGDSIYIHCISNKDSHKFLKVSCFNAVYFDFRNILKKLPDNQSWQFFWLPAKQIKEQ